MFALVEARRAGLFDREHLLPNIISGLIVGVVALPLAMAFAIASGAKPEQGLYTSIIAGLAVSIFGGTRVQIAGPTGAFIVILSAITARFGIPGLQLATLMAGAILLVMGLTNMGAVIKYIPDPVIVGFTAGIAVIIWVGQWQYFFGLPPASGEHFHQKLWSLLVAFSDLHLATTVLAAVSLFVVIVAPMIPGLKRVPGPLLAMIVATLLQQILQLEGVATIGSTFGAIPRGLPGLSFPRFTAAQAVELIGPAFTIAMLGAIESLLSAVVADGLAGTKHDSNQELVGQGIANIATPLFGGFAATGAIARTATNIRNGGTSPLAGIVHSLSLVVIVVVLAPYAALVPLAALAAILFTVANGMSERKHFIHMVRHAPRADVAILLITFALTIFVDLVIAVNIGVILAMMHFLKRMSSSVEVQQVTADEISRIEQVYTGLKKLPPDVKVYSIDGPFFFGAVESLEQTMAATHSDPRVLILRLRRVPFMDVTGLNALREVAENLTKRHVQLMLCEANERVQGKIEKAGIVEIIGKENCLETFAEAVDRCEALNGALHSR